MHSVSVSVNDPTDSIYEMRLELPTAYQHFIFLSRYSRWLEHEKRREHWYETVRRYVEFFRHRFPQLGDELYKEIYESILTLKILPSMRCLWTAGKALDKDNAAGYNCAFVSIDHQRTFSEIFYLLMVGCFHPDQLVKTSHGNKKISEITIDDEIMTYNEKTNEYYFVRPFAVIENDVSSKDKFELEFDDGTKVICTENHKFLTQRGWVEARDLTTEDEFEMV